MSIHAPAEVLTATRREGDSEGCVGQPLHQQEDERRRRTPTCDHVSKVDAVVEPQVGVDAFAVVVYEPGEAQASPA